MLPVDEDIVAHGASIRCPMRIQDDFSKLIVMSSNFKSRSQILNKLSSSQTEGANSNIVYAQQLLVVLYLPK